MKLVDRVHLQDRIVDDDPAHDHAAYQGHEVYASAEDLKHQESPEDVDQDFH